MAAGRETKEWKNVLEGLSGFRGSIWFQEPLRASVMWKKWEVSMSESSSV